MIEILDLDMKNMVCQIPFCKKNKTLIFGIETITHINVESLF